MVDTIKHWFYLYAEPFCKGLVIFIGATLGAMIVHAILTKAMRRISQNTENVFDDSLLKHSARPLKYIFFFIAINATLPLYRLPTSILAFVKQLTAIGLILTVSWLIARMTNVAEDIMMKRYNIDARDNLEARKIYTQLRVFKRIVTIVIAILALGTILMSFDRVRQLGTSILASAGIMGIVIGMAAQRTIANVIAGVQIAISQPIRIDDVVIVEGEWGRIEEITFTYVVVKIWDLRRLVVPISYFIEKPFQNWTRVEADLLGTVFLHLDYTVPVAELREELQRILHESQFWDGKVCGVQVTDAKEKTLEVRALMSAKDASLAWNLRCEVREKLIAFIQRRYPTALPKARAEIAPPLKAS